MKALVIPTDSQPYFVDTAPDDVGPAAEQAMRTHAAVDDLAMGLDHGMIPGGTGGFFVRGDGMLNVPRPNLLASMVTSHPIFDVCVVYGIGPGGGQSDQWWDDPDGSILGMVAANMTTLTQIGANPPTPSIVEIPDGVALKDLLFPDQPTTKETP